LRITLATIRRMRRRATADRSWSAPPEPGETPAAGRPHLGAPGIEHLLARGQQNRHQFDLYVAARLQAGRADGLTAVADDAVKPRKNRCLQPTAVGAIMTAATDRERR